MSEPTKNQVKGFALAHCIDFFNGNIDEQRLMATLRIAKEKWAKASA